MPGPSGEPPRAEPRQGAAGPRPGAFFRGRLESLQRALAEAPSEEIVRGFLALVLVGVLLALVFDTPSGRESLVSASETLAIAVIAFYFGLHKGTPHRPAGGQAGEGTTPPRQS